MILGPFGAGGAGGAGGTIFGDAGTIAVTCGGGGTIIFTFGGGEGVNAFGGVIAAGSVGAGVCSFGRTLAGGGGNLMALTLNGARPDPDNSPGDGTCPLGSLFAGGENTMDLDLFGVIADLGGSEDAALAFMAWIISTTDLAFCTTG